MKKKPLKNKKFSRGFSLIEIGVISIILIILITIVLSSMQSSRAKGRDSKRVSEVNALRTALQLYYMDNGRYPISTEDERWCSLEQTVSSADDYCDYFRSEIESYLVELPGDPLFGRGKEPTATTTYSYQYVSTSSGEGYKLHTDLETRDPYELSSWIGRAIAYGPSGGPGPGPGWTIPSGGVVGQWPTLGHDSFHSGFNPNAPSATNSIKWSFNTGTTFETGWIIIGSDGTVYTSDQANNIFAIDPDTGTADWTYNHPGAFFVSPPVIDSSGKIYVFTKTDLIILNPDGTLAHLEEDLISSVKPHEHAAPIIDMGGSIYVANNEGSLYAFNPDLSEKWMNEYTIPPGGMIVDTTLSTYAPTIGSDGTIYYAAGNQHLYALDPNTGNEIWAQPYDVEEDIYTAPVLSPDGSVIYVRQFGGLGHLRAVYTSTGLEYWRTSSGGHYGNSTVGPDGTIYVTEMNDLIAHDPVNGSQKWSYTMAEPGINTSPSLGGGMAYVHTYNSQDLYAINTTTQNLEWVSNNAGESQRGFGAVIANDGTVYVLDSSTGYIHAFEPVPPPPPPSGILYERYTEIAQESQPIYGSRWYGQTFTVGNTGPNANHWIANVKLNLIKIGNPAGDLIVSIRETDGAGLPVPAPAPDLTSATISCDTLPTTLQWVDIEFDTPYLLSADIKYAIVVRAPDSSQTDRPKWGMVYNSGTYDGGNAVQSLNGGINYIILDWPSYPTVDFDFEEWGTPE